MTRLSIVQTWLKPCFSCASSSFFILKLVRLSVIKIPFPFKWFFLEKKFFLVIIPDKFRYYRTSLFPLLFWVPITMSTINCYFCQINFKIIIYNVLTLAHPYLHYYSFPHRGWASNFGKNITLSDQGFLQDLFFFQSKQIPFNLILL